jgi:Zn-dependent protease
VFVLSIFFHECGHALAGKSRGIPMSGMVFIPFMGAAVLLKRGGRTVGEDAFIGIMGPVFGTIYGLGCLGIYGLTHHTLWLDLASFVFFMNLFNLLPIAPLDGGWIVPVFSPKVLLLGVLLMIPIGLRFNPFILVLGLLSIPRIISGWKVKPGESAYFKATARDRWTYGIAYPALAIFLALAWMAAQGALTALHGAAAII